jgi:DNA anti-recombination protein RmuC
MRKSIIFLLGSLVMLLPFGSSMNIFSDVMAVEMNLYMDNEDYSQRYEKFYKDDSFREAYYNYHKQHHQEEQQQQIEKEVQQSIGQEQQQQNSMTESLPQQSTQQQGPSSISQEQMHQQQIVKLKQLLEAVR